MNHVTFQGNRYALEAEESVLECLLRNGEAVPNSCRAGACQSCLLQATEGTPTPASTKPLRPTLVEQGYFLSCLCRPGLGRLGSDGDAASELVAQPPGAGLRHTTQIANIESLSETVALVQLERPVDFVHRAGQYITLIREDGLARSYSISAASENDCLNLHIRRIPGGAFTEWIHGEAQPGTPIQIQGPSGMCFYSEEIPLDKPILLAGTGTGLAPLYGILEDALARGHQGPIYLYHGAVNFDGLYLCETLTEIAKMHGNVTYAPSVLQAAGAKKPNCVLPRQGDLTSIILASHPNIKDFRVFLCGDPDLVKSLQTRLFLAGVPSKEIFADAFVPAPAAAAK